MAEVSEDDERSLGAQVDEAIRAQIPLIDDPVVIGFVNELGQRIVAEIEPQPFVYRFRVIPNSTLNAFALPGGYLYFHSATILEAASLDELAGVMGHEIAHVKGHHYARGTEKTFWPSLLARAAGIAAAVATGEPGFAAAAEGANVALQLKYSREFESEADEVGAVFMARAGFDPAGMGRFFERIVAAEIPGGIHIPPYLYSHPDLAQRIDGVKQRAATLHVSGARDPALEASFRDAQARLAQLLELGRTSLQGGPPYDRAASDPRLARANAAASAGRTDEAIAPARGGRAPRAERPAPALPPRRAPRRKRPHPRGDRGVAPRRRPRSERRPRLLPARRTPARRSATATTPPTTSSRRSGASSPAAPSSTAPSSRSRRSPTRRSPRRVSPTAAPVTERTPSPEAPARPTRPGDGEFVWWAQVDKRYGALRNHVRVRWSDPSGATVQDELAETLPKSHVSAHLALGEPLRGRYGVWRVEAVLGGQVIDRRSFAYQAGD